MSSPYFSIVIPTYNRATFIRKTLESVLPQTYRDFEVILVDDGSTDDTENIVKGIVDSRIRYFKKVNGERAAARNFGVQQARGNYVNFLDSDDQFSDIHLSEAFMFIQGTGAMLFHLGYDIRNAEGRILRTVNNLHSINRQILSGNDLSCNGIFAKRAVFVENPFNEDRALSGLEDWELWIRLSARYSFQNSKTITSSVIQHDNRSVVTADTLAIKMKVDCFVRHVLEDEMNAKTFGKELRKVAASAWTYAALHILMAKGNKMEALRYLISGVFRHPGEFVKKRFLVICARLVGL